MTEPATTTAMTACVPLGLEPSFGFGDRTGLATPGHVAALRQAGRGIRPIFPQQSIREMQRTGRTPAGVMGDALAGMQAAGWDGITGADADHLKTVDDIDVTLAAGFTFFTIDPSAHVDPQADDYDEATLRARFREVEADVDWLHAYLGRTICLPSGSEIHLDEAACLRAAVKYGRSINHTVALATHLDRVARRNRREYEVELSVDETEQPTSLAEHHIIADQCLIRGVKLVSLAPRFVGDFEKGVDFKGDLALLERSLQDHADLAAMLGPYKLSLHSGSDKLSMYPALARTTRGRFHVKTAGTSYLEALRVVARHDGELFRRIVGFARDRYESDRATYHVSARLDAVPGPEDLSSPIELEREYLELWSEVPAGRGFTRPGRQIVHCTFGSVLTHPEFGPAVLDALRQHADTYEQVLAEHFVRHLDALNAGL